MDLFLIPMEEYHKWRSRNEKRERLSSGVERVFMGGPTFRVLPRNVTHATKGRVASISQLRGGRRKNIIALQKRKDI